MITYVDTSSLLKLLIDEDGSERVERIWDSSDVVAGSALIVVEARAALAAAARGARLTPAQHREARGGLAVLVEELSIVDVTEQLIADAAELAEQEALRGYDAVHLASALMIGADLVTSADANLCDVAGSRGLHVVNPLDGWFAA
ncbi:type II toxin-antitoxin system VapC family toxin [Rhabdothermincola sp.]|uniref:type II toxin-antitoxin system VapC family toxin n=1 Tax=Rhabdothermincola sp. TaxID=2820405 RepID=UPI002FE199B9